MKSYQIYTDGAYSSLRDQGGIGIVVLNNNKKILSYFHNYKHTTNNQMELLAIIIALATIKNPIDSLVIYSDSMYCIGCITKNWKRKKNSKLWEKFEEQYSRVSSLCSNIKFQHVKGHNGDTWNTYVDKLANKASQLL